MLLLPLLFFCVSVSSDNWALLLAGSNGFYNYRHQADIAHAHRYLETQKFDMDKVVIFMYDDVSRHKENNRYNHLKNHPNGRNNYKDIRVDYTKDDVSQEVFEASISGNLSVIRERGTGRYLNVTNDDTVFIYLSDHGSTGLFALPNGYLTADEIVRALRDLKKRCKYVLIFVEACESGSLFARKLTNADKGIFAISASNSKESSYATYYDAELDTYLGDEFSVNFLEYLDATDQSTHILRDLYKHVKNKTQKSHVSPFGDRSMLNLNLSTFFKDTHYKPSQKLLKKSLPKEATETVAAPDVDVAIARKRLLRNPHDEEAREIIENSRMIEALFSGVQSMIYHKYKIDVTARKSSKTKTQDMCYERSLNHYYYKMSEYIGLSKNFEYFGLLKNACDHGLQANQVIKVLNKVITEALAQKLV